ncbi:MAG: cation:dicarboxylase symporter family transporter, partial [Planctomycetota bacterium]|nr:cation:dicarboxylase symporter family transporter [Planctomycetota bacterium]
EVDFLEVFIPSNIFLSLTRDYVPGVILLCICIGLAIGQLRRRRLLIAQLDMLGEALIWVSSAITRLSPLGVFALAASAAGTMTLGEAARLQAYLLSYGVGVLLLGTLVLPMLVTVVTPLRYRDTFMIGKTAALTVFATGKLIIVLPLLVQETTKLFARLDERDHELEDSSVEVLYPLAYAFPHVGKLLALLFIPFAAWFLGQPLGLGEYPKFLSTGLLSYFGGPILATPFLLDLMHIPHDMFQLFLLTGVVSERLGDALGVIHLITFCLITTSFLTGRARFDLRRLLWMLGITTAAGVAAIILLQSLLSHTLQFAETEEEVIAKLQQLDDVVDVKLISDSKPNPDPLLEGESLLDRVYRRGTLRVGYDADNLPFAFWSTRGKLIGFDISMAEGLARDLGVSLEFVRFERRSLLDQLAADHFDVVMSGLVGTLERAAKMEHTSPYLHVTLALVVPDYRARDFTSLERIRGHKKLRIGFVDLSRGFVERFKALLPNAELVELRTNREYFERAWQETDALLISGESGAPHTLLYPDFETVVPEGVEVTLPLFYAVGARDRKMREFLEHWVALRKGDGTFDEHYKRWVLGRLPEPAGRRWSVMKDVLGWID